MQLFFICFSYLVVVQTAVYYAYGITGWTIAATAAVGGILLVSLRKSETSGTISRLIRLPTLRRSPDHAGLVRALPVILADLVLLALFLAVRTGEALDTPWVIGAAPFLLWGLATAVYLVVGSTLSTRTAGWLLTLHLFTTLSVVAIVVKHGFGFDPIIHEAAEKYIDAHGAILPKTPYYIGQYVLVVMLHKLTLLPVLEINRWLLPALAALTLPWILVRSIGARRSALILLLPLAPLTFTTPYNLTVLILLWVLFARPGRGAGALLGLAATAIHPLLGIPILILATTRGWPTFLLTSFVPPLLLGISNAMQTGGRLTVLNPLPRLDYFTGLFREPITFASHAPAAWEALYLFARLLPFLVIALGMFTAVRQRSYHLVAAAAGLLVAVFLLATAVPPAPVIWYEQSEFVLRLFHVIPLLMLSLVLSSLRGSGSTEMISLGRDLILTGVLTVSWYLSYPQVNPKSLIAGWNMGNADLAAVRLMDERAGGEPYRVLGNQMTAAAALRLFGFERTLAAYPLPTNGARYPFALQMLSDPNRGAIVNFLKSEGVRRGFLALDDYWPYFDEVRTRLRTFADRVYTVEKGRALVFEFTTD